ncbi:MAG: hypothetical protein BJ554DRAFT_5924, partial [Olpidium bornovanus]
AARLAAALAAAAAVAVVVVLPGRPAALAAPFNPRSSYDFSRSSYDFGSDSDSDADSVDHRPAALAAPSGNFPADDVDHTGAPPFNHESVSHSLQPDGPSIEDGDGVGFMNFSADDVDYTDAAPFNHESVSHSLQPGRPLVEDEDDVGFMDEPIMRNLALAVAAMMEAAKSIRGDGPDEKYPHFFAKAEFQRFFKKRLSMLLKTAKTKEPQFQDENEHLPIDYKRSTVAEWIMSFARSRCGRSVDLIQFAGNVYRTRKENNKKGVRIAHYWRVDNGVFRKHYWHQNLEILQDLKTLVDTINHMANEFVEKLQANGVQRRSAMYTAYADNFQITAERLLFLQRIES